MSARPKSTKSSKLLSKLPDVWASAPFSDCSAAALAMLDKHVERARALVVAATAPSVPAEEEEKADGFLDGMLEARALLRGFMHPDEDDDRVIRAMEHVSSAIEMIKDRGLPAGSALDGLKGARHSLNSLRTTLWHRFEHKPPTCDTCDKPAAWEHPEGGLRCEGCKRP